MRSLIQEIEFDCNEGERPPMDALIKQKRELPKQHGEQVLSMEFEALGSSIHIPVPEQAKGKRVRVILEVLK